jgi:hypothetical protein
VKQRPSRHGWQHRPGGEDPIAVRPTQWAILASGSGETLGADSDMTFAFADANFNTNEPQLYALRSGSPPYQGIAIKRQGVYEVSWWIQALAFGAISPGPDETMIKLVRGTSFDDTYVNDVDLAGAESYGQLLEGSGSDPHWEGTQQNLWNVRSLALVGIAAAGGERFVNLGAQNRSPSFDFPDTDGQGLYGRIYVKRLSSTLADYSTFF